jgi:peptidoglycan hydrolase-like protein with peptidoglycan-binding domain
VLTALLALAVLLSVQAADARPVERATERPAPVGGPERLGSKAPGLDQRDRERARRTARARSRLARARAVQSWSGYAFDACRAPSSRAMDRWRVASPFRGVGIYIGGPLRACPQKHLTRRWVARQTRRGWRTLPIWVGPQAGCTGYRKRISPRPAAARHQGVRAARGARTAARRLGITAGSTLWYDLEWFPAGQGRCRRSALQFLGAWTRTLHRDGYRSGLYSSVSAGIKVVGKLRGHGTYPHPDAIWFAWDNGRRDTWLGRDWLRAPRWKANRRVHQYALDVRASYGGVRMAIDRNYVDLGSSPALRRAPAVCGRDADRPHYRTLHRGERGQAVRTAECLLGSTGHLRDRPDGHYGRTTRNAVRRFQRSADLRPTGRLVESSWVALLAAGPRPILKHGAQGPPVRRLQRSLTAALPGAVTVHGHFGPGTSAAVRRYQRRAGLRVTGVAAFPTWRALQHGRVGAPGRQGGHAKASEKRAQRPGKQAAKQHGPGQTKAKHHQPKQKSQAPPAKRHG